jgi:steroid delta-isomerase-like uncharacterized protein
MRISAREAGAIIICILLGAFIGGCDKSTKGTAGTNGEGMTDTAVIDSTAATEKANIEITQRFIEEALNHGNLDFARQHTAQNYVEHDPVPGQEPGWAGFEKWLVDFRKAFPDMHITVDDIIAKGDKVIIRSTMTGTQKGPMNGMPPTNKSVKVEGIDIIRIVDGKQTDHWGQTDIVGLMTQLGMMPPMDAPHGAGAGKMNGGKMETKKDTM